MPSKLEMPVPYVVVNRENAPPGQDAPCSVLSRAAPAALLSWAPWEGAGSPPGGAITFETYFGARKCADMQGGAVHQIGAVGFVPFSGAQEQLMEAPIRAYVWPGRGMG